MFFKCILVLCVAVFSVGFAVPAKPKETMQTAAQTIYDLYNPYYTSAAAAVVNPYAHLGLGRAAVVDAAPFYGGIGLMDPLGLVI